MLCMFPLDLFRLSDNYTLYPVFPSNVQMMNNYPLCPSNVQMMNNYPVFPSNVQMMNNYPVFPSNVQRGWAPEPETDESRSEMS